jgi:putative flippase GtrA
MIRRELIIFLLVGLFTVLIDYFFYRGLVWSQWASVESAKSIGFIIGTFFAYLANRFCTFARVRCAAGSIWRFAVLYSITLFVNVSVNTLAIDIFMGSSRAANFAFLIATTCSAVMNFIGMKFFVFKVATPLKAI